MREEDFNYKILNPGGNKTALVEGLNYSKEERKIINDIILNKNKDVEQVGFIDKEKKILEMAGGEFCMNATRCAIYEFLNAKEGKIELSVSGVKEKIKGGINKDKSVYAKLNIKKSKDELIEKRGIFNLVKLDGILQVVVEENNLDEFILKLKEDEEKAKIELKEIMESFNSDEEAVGIVLLEKENGKLKINPVVWVKEIDTIFYETACGSGSLATAIYKSFEENINEIELLQPSGYSINVKLEKRVFFIENAIITGIVVEEKI